MRLLEQENVVELDVQKDLATAMTMIDEYATGRKSDSTEDGWVSCTGVGTTIYWAFDETIPVTTVSNGTISIERNNTYSQHPQRSDSGSAAESWGSPAPL